MHIDKFKGKDGYYYAKDGCSYDTDMAFMQDEVFGFCCCGSPEANLLFIKKGLTHIDSPRPKKAVYEGGTQDEWSQWYDKWISEGDKIFGGEQARYFFFYWADKEGLTEHGGSVPGWLTDKGKRILEDLVVICSIFEED